MKKSTGISGVLACVMLMIPVTSSFAESLEDEYKQKLKKEYEAFIADAKAEEAISEAYVQRAKTKALLYEASLARKLKEIEREGNVASKK